MALAREPIKQEDAGSSIEVVQFILGGEGYAIESHAVREVYPLRDLTPLPCTPPFVMGIINVRGQILAVLDLRRFFDLPIQGLTDASKVIILGTDQIRVGLLANSVAGVRAIAADSIQPPLPTLSGIHSEYLRGVTAEPLVILDAARILGDDKIIVHEEVQT